jgi:hypothetical protein
MGAPTFTVGNAKLGPNMLTWQRPYGATCPDTCELLDINVIDGAKGCYADPEKRGRNALSMLHGATRRLGHIPPIASMRAKDTLRFHVSGDFMAPGSKNADTAYIDGIRRQLIANSDAVAFTYSHMWQEYESDLAPLRDLMTINASCANAEQVREAVDANWRIAYHGTDVDPDSTYHVVAGERLLVCPEQRGKVDNCGQCKVCWKPSERFAGVAFIDH